jgi:hypothetical protein
MIYTYVEGHALTKPDREPLFGHGNTFDRGLPVVGEGGGGGRTEC